MDTTAVEAVKEWREGYSRAGIHLALVDPSPQIVTILHRSGCLDTGDHTGPVTPLLLVLRPVTAQHESLGTLISAYVL